MFIHIDNISNYCYNIDVRYTLSARRFFMDFLENQATVPVDKVAGVKIWLRRDHMVWLSGLDPDELNRLINDPDIKSFVWEDYRGKRCVVKTDLIADAEEFDGDIDNDEDYQELYES